MLPRGSLGGIESENTSSSSLPAGEYSGGGIISVLSLYATFFLIDDLDDDRRERQLSLNDNWVRVVESSLLADSLRLGGFWQFSLGSAGSHTTELLKNVFSCITSLMCSSESATALSGAVLGTRLSSVHISLILFSLSLSLIASSNWEFSLLSDSFDK